MDPSTSEHLALVRNDAQAPHAPRRNWRVRAFGRADRWFQRFLRLTSVIHEGFWLACLNPDDLNAITEKRYSESQYYASRGHNISGLFDWEKAAVERYFRPGFRVLVAAAGGGREVLALCNAGFDAEGFECSLPLVYASQKTLSQLVGASRVIHCPADTVPEGPRVYEGLIVGWTAYMHIPTNARRIRFLQALRQRALPESPVLISFLTRNRNANNDVVVHRTARFFKVFIDGRRDPLELGDHVSNGRYMHCFTHDEIESEMRSSGFSVAHYSEEGDLGHAVGIAT